MPLILPTPFHQKTAFPHYTHIHCMQDMITVFKVWFQLILFPRRGVYPPPHPWAILKNTLKKS
jgi:hypothetical protein